MSRLFEKINKKHIFLTLAAIVAVVLIVFTQWLTKLNDLIDTQLQQKRFSPPLEFYSAPLKFFKGLKVQSGEIISSLQTSGFQERPSEQAIVDHDYFVMTADQCKQKLPDIQDPMDRCIVIKKSDGTHLIAVNTQGEIIDVYDYNILQPISVTELEPVLFAQFYGKEPILRSRVQLGDAPPICLNSLLAIEDNKFLEHQGVSWIGIMRAFARNIIKGRLAQGGSTITQQLVKNYFLTNEKKFSRKFKEVFMALLLETKSSKDDILEAYINEIYMGQNGSFQIRGFGAASDYYFGKKLTDLNLPECALIAALVNSPGLFNPFKNQKNALDRRKKVLTKLLEAQTISQQEFDQAEQYPLPHERAKILSEPAPYFVDAVMRQLDDMKVDTSQGLKIETTLNLHAQESAQKAVALGIEDIEKSYKKIQTLKEKGKQLEGFLVSADPATGQVQAIVGGRSFRMTQYNRAIQSRRQTGSIIKPFVYLTALSDKDSAGNNYQPLTLLDDTKFNVKYEGQEWSPNNYDDKYFGQVPMYFALKSSLNSATASLGLKIGLPSVIETAQKAGITSELKPYPALALGVFEVSAFEVLEAYSTFARMGEKTSLSIIRKIKNLNDVVIFENVVQRDQALDATNTAILVGMMKQTVLNGSAIGVTMSGFNLPAAGKTGTTNDFRDSWFAGFTPLHVAVTWVGYDDNTPSGLSGATGAVPLWIRYMKEYAGQFPATDFSWPDTVEKRDLTVGDQITLGVPENPKHPMQPIELIFKKAN